MVESDLVTILTPTLTIIATTSGLVTVLIKGITWLNKKQDEKASILKKQTEEYADNLKKQAENVAANLKTNNEMIAVSLAKVATDTATTLARVATDTALTLKENNEKIANSLKDNNEKTSILLTTKLGESNEKLTALSTAFKERADLTNGNVAAIRTEFQDFKEDFYSRDDIEAENRDRRRDNNNRDDYSSQRRNARKRTAITRNRSDVNKRREIEQDRVSQRHGSRE